MFPRIQFPSFSRPVSKRQITRLPLPPSPPLVPIFPGLYRIMEENNQSTSLLTDQKWEMNPYYYFFYWFYPTNKPSKLLYKIHTTATKRLSLNSIFTIEFWTSGKQNRKILTLNYKQRHVVFVAALFYFLPWLWTIQTYGHFKGFLNNNNKINVKICTFCVLFFACLW